VQAADVHGALGRGGRESAQRVEGEMGVRLNPSEAKSAILFEKLRGIAAWTIPGS
jgi:hypothetical protein